MVILHLGSNVEVRLDYLQLAIDQIKDKIGEIRGLSPIYETEAWGVVNQSDFLNLALRVSTRIESPRELLRMTQQIEKNIGRNKTILWGPRQIDIDILDVNGSVIEMDDLEIPHPGIPNRNFVLYPLRDLSPSYIHPVLNKHIDVMIEDSSDCQYVRETTYGLSF